MLSQMGVVVVQHESIHVDLRTAFRYALSQQCGGEAIGPMERDRDTSVNIFPYLVQAVEKNERSAAGTQARRILWKGRMSVIGVLTVGSQGRVQPAHRTRHACSQRQELAHPRPWR